MDNHDRTGSMATARRSFLMLTAAGSGALLAGYGAGALYAAEADEAVTPTEDLMREHGILRRVLIVYSETAAKLGRDSAAVDAKALAAAAMLFSEFGEHYHERLLEEQHVFPAVRRTGGDAAVAVDTLVAQHRRGREITGFVLDATRSGSIGSANGTRLAAALEGMVRMYRAHAAREDTVVFPAWKKTMSVDELKDVGERFEDIEHQQFGRDGFEDALARIASVEQALGLDDLADFTAAAPSV